MHDPIWFMFFIFLHQPGSHLDIHIKDGAFTSKQECQSALDARMIELIDAKLLERDFINAQCASVMP